MAATVIAESEAGDTCATIGQQWWAIEIEFATGARMRIAGAVDAATVSGSSRGVV